MYSFLKRVSLFTENVFGRGSRGDLQCLLVIATRSSQSGFSSSRCNFLLMLITAAAKKTPILCICICICICICVCSGDTTTLERRLLAWPPAPPLPTRFWSWKYVIHYSFYSFNYLSIIILYSLFITPSPPVSKFGRHVHLDFNFSSAPPEKEFVPKEAVAQVAPPVQSIRVKKTRTMSKNQKRW